MGMFDWLFGRRNDVVPQGQAESPFPVSPGEQTRVPHFAIIDVETTGLSPRQNRVLELAVVRVDAGGDVIDEWSSRFDPEGPVGATHIHGITQADVTGAPLFRDVAAMLIPYIAGVPLAAHNATFDLAFLRAEFQRAGWDAPWLPAFCTLNGSREFLPNLDRRRLADCCWAAGVPLENAHSALGDARATAGLLSYYLQQAGGRQGHVLSALPEEARSVVWPGEPSHAPFLHFPDETDAAPRSRPRRITPSRPSQPSLLQQLSDLSLLEAVEEGAPEGTVAYLETLLDALEDGEVSEEEAGDLADLIGIYDLTDADIRAAHTAVLTALSHKAVDDGHVSSDERAELHALAHALDVPANSINALIVRADAARAARMSADLRPLPESWRLGVPLRVGDKVVFTGCDDAQRGRLERLAEKLGVRVMGNVSRLTSMLVTDGSMDGTKLAKAREVGTRIVHPDTFETLLAHLQPALAPEAPRQALKSTPSPARPPGRESAVHSPSSSTGDSPSEVRAWALANGYATGVRGRISSDIWEAFAARQASGTPMALETLDPRVEIFEFQGEPTAPLGRWSYAPMIPTQAMALTGGGDMKVVDQAKYQTGIRRAIDRLNDDAPELMALLVAEPLHPQIPHAVRVDLLVDREREVAGYLTDQESETFHELVKSAMEIGALPLMRARVSGGTADEPALDVWLVHFAQDVVQKSVTGELIERSIARRIADGRS